MRVHFFLAMVLCTALGGGVVWMLRPSSGASEGDPAEIAGGQPEDDDAEAAHATAGPARVERDPEHAEDPVARTELDSRGAEAGVREQAAVVLVQSQDGAPLADALVEARNRDGITDRKRTDASGRTTVLLPRVETFMLRASAEGYFPSAVAEHEFGQQILLVLRQAALLTGTVRDCKGEPVEGVLVEPRGPAGAPRSAQARKERTDKDGNFKLPPLVPGTYDLWLEPQKDKAPTTVVAGLYFQAGYARQDLALPEGHAIVGVVRDAVTKLPIPAAAVEVRVDLKQGQLRGYAFDRKTISDAAGTFETSLLPVGNATITASAPGHTVRSISLPITSTRGRDEVELLLEASVTLAGRTLTADGAPVAGAEVTLGWWQSDHLEWSEKKTTSDAEGRYELADLPVKDAAFLCLTKPGFATDATGLGKLTPGERREVDLRFQRGVELRGRVRGESNEVPNVNLRLVPRLGAERFATASTVDGNGDFVLAPVAPFAYRLEVTAVGYVEYAKDVNLDRNKPTTDIGTITLARAWDLEGSIVLRPENLGVPFARVSFQPVSDKEAPRRSVMADEYGAFSTADLKAGSYRVWAQGVGFRQKVPVVVDVPRTRKTKLLVEREDAPPTGAIAGRVFDVVTRMPVEGFSILNVEPRRLAKADGEYRASGLQVGMFDLRIDARGYQSALLPGIYVRAGETTRIRDVFLSPGGAMDLRVLDPKGKPIPANQLQVQLTDKLMRTLSHQLQPIETQGDKGFYRFDGLALSSFELTVRGPKELQPWTQTIELMSAERRRIEARMQPVPPPPKKQPPAKPPQPQKKADLKAPPAKK